MVAGSPVRTVIDSRRPSILGQATALWHYRDLALLFGRRDISVRYRQTGLGLLWVVLQPALGALLFSFVFQRVGHIEAGTDYFTFALAGLVAWTFFANLTSRSSLSLLNNTGLLSKSFFPRLVLPVASTPAALVDLVVALVLVLVVSGVRGQQPSLSLLLIPLAVAPLALIALGIGLILSALSVRFRDVQQVVPFGLQIGLYASPVAYPASAVPSSLQSLFQVNPLVGALDTFRHAIVGTPVDGAALAYSWGASVVLMLVGAAFFIRRQESFADVA